MQADLKEIFNEPGLLSAPVKRAAYSDRTAWLMAAMSELAYFKFEDVNIIEELVKEIAGEKSAHIIRKKLDVFLAASKEGKGDKVGVLKDILSSIKFELINTYNEGTTQVFLARRMIKDGDMLVLAFRGTEASFGDLHQTVEDVKADLTANLIPIEGDGEIHQGFYNAFSLVKDQIAQDLKAHEEAPLYITGHSLGGAVAVVATRFLANDSHGACYTFGSPRVGNESLARGIKTPIYRIVNAADVVPRLPPAMIVYLFIVLFRWLPATKWLVALLRKIKGYVHYGDMRYLVHVDAGQDERFAGIELISNPSFFDRIMRLVPRWVMTRGKAAASDHSISLYRRKLQAYALNRN